MQYFLSPGLDREVRNKAKKYIYLGLRNDIDQMIENFQESPDYSPEGEAEISKSQEWFVLRLDPSRSYLAWMSLEESKWVPFVDRNYELKMCQLLVAPEFTFLLRDPDDNNCVQLSLNAANKIYNLRPGFIFSLKSGIYYMQQDNKMLVQYGRHLRKLMMLPIDGQIINVIGKDTRVYIEVISPEGLLIYVYDSITGKFMKINTPVKNAVNPLVLQDYIEFRDLFLNLETLQFTADRDWSLDYLNITDGNTFYQFRERIEVGSGRLIWICKWIDPFAGESDEVGKLPRLAEIGATGVIVNNKLWFFSASGSFVSGGRGWVQLGPSPFFTNEENLLATAA